jgi:hypothetical protein
MLISERLLVLDTHHPYACPSAFRMRLVKARCREYPQCIGCAALMKKAQCDDWAFAAYFRSVAAARRHQADAGRRRRLVTRNDQRPTQRDMANHVQHMPSVLVTNRMEVAEQLLVLGAEVVGHKAQRRRRPASCARVALWLRWWLFDTSRYKTQTWRSMTRMCVSLGLNVRHGFAAPALVHLAVGHHEADFIWAQHQGRRTLRAFHLTPPWTRRNAGAAWRGRSCANRSTMRVHISRLWSSAALKAAMMRCSSALSASAAGIDIGFTLHLRLRGEVAAPHGGGNSQRSLASR